jgi:hypothetical protein
MAKRLERLKNTVNKYMVDITTRATYDLSVRMEVGHKSTTECNVMQGLLNHHMCWYSCAMLGW